MLYPDGAGLVEDLERSSQDGPRGSHCPKCGGLITTEDQHLNCTDEKRSGTEHERGNN